MRRLRSMFLILIVLSTALLACIAGDLMLVRYMREATRAHTREKQALMQTNTDLTDRIMHMSGSTWTPPPRPEIMEDVESEDHKRYREGWVGV